MVPGDDAVGDRRLQRLEHGIDDGHREGHPPAHRRRLLGAHDAPHGDDDLQIAEAAVVYRIVGRRCQAFERDLGTGIPRCHARVVEPLDLLGHLGEVDRHPVALDGHTDPDRHRPGDIDPVVVHEGFGLVDSVRDRECAAAGGRLGLVHDRRDAVEHRVPAVAADEFEEAPFSAGDRRELRAEVAHRPLRQADVHLQDVEEILVDDPGPLVFEDRDLQTFRIDVGGHAAERAADIRPVRHADGEPDQRAVVEDRQAEGQVVEMAAGDIGVVGQQNIARPDIVAEMAQLRLHRFRHAADEHRQAEPDRDRLALRGEQPDGEVERLVHDHVVGGAGEVGLHLLGDGDDAVPHQLGDHRIGGTVAHRPPDPTRIRRLP